MENIKEQNCFVYHFNRQVSLVQVCEDLTAQDENYKRYLIIKINK